MRWRVMVACAAAAMVAAAAGLAVAMAGGGGAAPEAAVSRWAMALLAGAIVGAAGGRIAAALASRPLRDAVAMARRLAGAAGEAPAEWAWNDPDLSAIAAALGDTADRLARQVREMAAERGRLEAVLAHMASGVLLIDARGRLEVANPAARRMLGLSSDDVGRPHIEATKNFHLSEAIDRVLTTGAPETMRLTLVHGGERWVEASLASARGAGGEPAGVVVALHDVTEQVRLERLRSDFLANVSHELRTPVTAIKGFAETMLDGALEDTARRRSFVSFIDREAGRLVRLVEDLMDLARLEVRQVSLAREDLDVSQVVAHVVEGFRARAAGQSIDLELALPPRPLYCYVDGARLEQVLVNLLDNALKFTPPGGRVTVSLRQEPDQAMRLEVADTGQGMEPEELKLIFERFYRTDRGRSRQTGGTGLGLAIVKQIVLAHGGRVWAESAPGQGATFYVVIPRWPPEPARRPPGAAGGEGEDACKGAE